MAASAPALRTSLIPIFITRLRLLLAIVPTLRELPQPCWDELRSLLERAQKLVEEATGLPTASESQSSPKPQLSSDVQQILVQSCQDPLAMAGILQIPSRATRRQINQPYAAGVAIQRAPRGVE
jgi:hypothetical protein